MGEQSKKVAESQVDALEVADEDLADVAGGGGDMTIISDGENYGSADLGGI